MTLGLLFDLDGTIIDSDHLHFESFNMLLGEFGRAIDWETYKTRVMGGANEIIMRYLFPELSVAEHAAIADRKEAMFRAACQNVGPVAGLPQLLRDMQAQDVPIRVVTNAPRANAEHMLRAVGLESLLPGAVIGEEIERGKPDPLPYLVGLERIGRTADRAIAFEDSVSGVTSASRAGIYTVGLTTGLAAETLRSAGADRIISDYRDPDLLAFLQVALRGDPIRRL